MCYNFKDKVAIITGSSQGIGLAIAQALAKRGTRIVLNGRNKEKLDRASKAFTAKNIDHLAIAGDISDYSFCTSLIDQTINKFGQLDILINNAGISAEGKIAETNPEVFRTSFAVNVLGVIYPSKAAIPYLKKTRGSIVLTGSVAGMLGLPEFSAYSGTKMALTAIAQSLRIELAGSGVHVGLNYVGFVENENKTFINKDGKVEAMPERASFRRMSKSRVAEIFIRGIEKRRKVQVLSVLGKATWLLSRLVPRLFERIMTSRYLKNQRS